MGVGDWSAYDMMLILVRDGLVKREFVNDKKPGRSRLLFNLTELGQIEACESETHSNLIGCVVSLSHAIGIAYICIPEILSRIEPNASHGGKWVLSFANELFEALIAEKRLVESVMGSNKKINMLRSVFLKSSKNLGKSQLISLAKIATASLHFSLGKLKTDSI